MSDMLRPSVRSARAAVAAASVTLATACGVTLPPADSPATIAVSASTNTRAYTVLIRPDGTAITTTDGVAPAVGMAGAAETNAFFAELRRDVPVSHLAVPNGCTKSVSFGTSTTITYGGSTSGDVSCGDSGSPALSLSRAEASLVQSIVTPGTAGFSF